ncbi:hypothetical protein COOONC_04280, partial [Cooperia oncophora]
MDEDRPFRMWFPQTTNKFRRMSFIPKLSKRDISKCRAVANSVEWDSVLPETDTVDEVKMREKRLRTDIGFGPTLRRRLCDYLARNHKTCSNGSYKVDNLDYFARAEISTTESDVLKQCSVSVSGFMNDFGSCLAHRRWEI